MITSAQSNPEESPSADAAILSLVAQQTTNAVVITDSRGDVEWVNEGFTRLTGYTLADVRGRTPGSVLQGADTDQGAVERLRLAIRAGQSISEEVLNYTKAGAPYWVSLQISPIFDERGGLARFIAIEIDVTEKRAALEALRRGEAYLRAVIGSIPVILFAIDRDGIFTLSEGKGLDALGLRPGEVVGRSIFDVYANQPQVVAAVRRALAGEDFPLVLQTGSLAFDTRYSAMRDDRGAIAGTIGVSIDVSDRLLATAALQTTSTRLSTLIASLQAAVIVEDERRLLTLANRVFCEMFRIPAPPEALIGTNCAESARASAYLFDDPDVALARIDQILQRRQPISAELVPMADGRMLERDYVPIFVDSAYQGHLWLYRDITSRMRDTTDLLRAKEAAEAATRAKSAFLATMSHEIRTPLNAMIGMTSLILDTELTDDQRQYAETIRSSGDMLLGLINNILDFSKIESGYMDLEQQPFSMRSCIEEVVDLLGPSAAEKGLSLRGEVHGRVPQQIVGDITRVRQVLVNLASNAVKFTSGGEVRLRATVRPSRRWAGELEIIVRVSDSGIGIAPDRISRLFQPFSQLDASTTKRFGGTGLGLAISRRLSELMGGTITVRSRAGVGSIFRFTFRATPAAASEAASVSSARRLPQPAGGAAVRYPLRVLVAEDNSVNQHVVLRMLDRMGYRADLAANGLEVLAALRRQSYDVVLMDVQMPELDGIDATRELRAMLPADRQPYVIAVTANALSGDREACLAAGMDDYISKPMQRAELESALLHAGAQRAIMPTAVAAAPTAALAMPVFQMLRESLGDDGELVRLLSLFRQQAEQDIVAMRALASAGESPLMISRLAHRLKGSGASLGADMLAQLCQTLDTYTHQGSIADAAAMIDAIEREYARVCAALDSGIDGQPAIR